MESKYYSPTIDEFYVGFEIERRSFIAIGENKTIEQWNRFKIKDLMVGWDIKSFEKEIINGYIRVKYLDKSDIEELGFIEIGQEEYYLNGDLKSWNIERLSQDNNSCYYRIELPDEDFGFRTILFATIKNKSELKKLLTQLNIK